MSDLLPPSHVDKLTPCNKKEKKVSSHERKSKDLTMAKPNGIIFTRNRYKVTLRIEGKDCHIGYYKTLEAAKEALEEAKKDAGNE